MSNHQNTLSELAAKKYLGKAIKAHSEKNKHHANAISDLGFNDYSKAYKGQSSSSVDVFHNYKDHSDKAWDKCNQGCHVANYRAARKEINWHEFIGILNGVSPLAAGFVDGAQHSTVGKVERLGGGVRRTAEGLGINGKDKFNKVGGENFAVYQFATTSFEKLITLDINLIDNPITQSVMAIVTEYMSLIPEWVIEELVETGAFKFKEYLDETWLSRAHNMGLIQDVSKEDLLHVTKKINQRKMIGSFIGKKYGPALACAIATSITKNILGNKLYLKQLDRTLKKLKKHISPGKGHLGKALLIALGTQGYLDKAAQASRRLQSASPSVRSVLRNRLQGADMVYFLIEPYTQEYIDRLVLLKNDPKLFSEMMHALIKAKDSQSIIYATKS